MNWFKQTDAEIVSFLKKNYQISELIFIGQYSTDQFTNIKSIDYCPLDYLANEDLNSKFNEKKLCVDIQNYLPNLKNGELYKFKAKLAPQKKREEDENSFALEVDESFRPVEYNPAPKEFIQRRFEIEERNSLSSDQLLARALTSIQREINKSPETFIFELLQNASDYPDEARNNKVCVDFIITDNYLLFCHSGSPFKVNNVNAICSINESDKADDIEKIGFKGIGFKSVFKDCNFAYIKSGGYSFRFDKSHFLVKKPYQIIPIWTEFNALESEVFECTTFKYSSVSIALKPSKKERLYKYEQILTRLFIDERILLFLPNIEKIQIKNQNGFNRELSENLDRYWIGNQQVSIPQEIKEWINNEIEDNESVIPEKYYDIKTSNIQFASSRSANIIMKTDNSVIYNYLPTKVNLGFDFLINGDFIPDGTREFFHDNDWNHYLMEMSGISFLRWLKTIGEKKKESDNKIDEFKRNYITIIPDFEKLENIIIDDRNEHLVSSFKKGFEVGLLGNEYSKAISFIPTISETLVTLSDIIIDETGITGLLQQNFLKHTDYAKKLIHNESGDGIKKIKSLIVKYGKGEIYSINNLKNDFQKDAFQSWMKDPDNNARLIQHLISNNELTTLLDTERIILSENNQLLSAKELYRSVPPEISFVGLESINTELAKFLYKNDITLNLKTFDPIAFYRDYIFKQKKQMNLDLKSIGNLLNFWNFIYDYWDSLRTESSIKNKGALQNFSVLIKPQSTEQFSISVVSNAYISVEFDQESEIEAVINEMKIQDAAFISPLYITKDREAKNWLQIFRKAKAITDLQAVIDTVINKLSEIEVENHLEVGIQIFKFWKKNKDTKNELTGEQIHLVKKNLKIKCTDSLFRDASETIISDHYSTNKPLKNILSTIKLPIAISSDYNPNQNDINNWSQFFVIIGCVELSEKQEVLEKKLSYYVENQKMFQEKHFTILKNISKTHTSRFVKNIRFNKQILSRIKLLTTNEKWLPPNQIHLSSIFKPILDLQGNESINSVDFLNENYQPQNITTKLLIELGVNDDFKFHTEETNRDGIPNKYRMYIEDNHPRVKSNAVQYRYQHKLVNHVSLNYPELFAIKIYADMFWKNISSKNSTLAEFISQKSTYKYYFGPISIDNWFIYFIKNNSTLSNQINVLKKTTQLYSLNLAKYINDRSLLPVIDLTKIIVDEETKTTLEEVIGVRQSLGIEQCLLLLTKENINLTQEQVTDLNLVECLSSEEVNMDELDLLKFPNINYEWKQIHELLVTDDEAFDIDKSRVLHSDFTPLAHTFNIQKLSEENLIYEILPGSPAISEDIQTFFLEKAKYIAFKIDQTSFSVTEAEIIEQIQRHSFYEVTSIKKVFPKDNPVYKSEEMYIYVDGNSVYYTDYWKTNSAVIYFLLEKINSDKVEKRWFENVVNRWSDTEITDYLKQNVGQTPAEWGSKNKEIGIKSNTGFYDEVYEYIENMNEVEDIYDADKIEDLKSILQNFKGHSKENKKSLNLLAKLKLCKQLRINYDNDWNFNIVENVEQSYFIHSARGSFAYIHPNEILKMRHDGFKMAIDYGRNDIKIYHDPKDIIKLHDNYLFLYQDAPHTDEILTLCEESQNRKKFHFLIVDKEKQTDDTKAILRLLNSDNYD